MASTTTLDLTIIADVWHFQSSGTKFNRHVYVDPENGVTCVIRGFVPYILREIRIDYRCRRCGLQAGGVFCVQKMCLHASDVVCMQVMWPARRKMWSACRRYLQTGDFVCMQEMLSAVCLQKFWSACKWCGLHAGDVACRQKMWSACRRCLQAGDVVCMQEMGNLFTILLPKLHSRQRKPQRRYRRKIIVGIKKIASSAADIKE